MLKEVVSNQFRLLWLEWCFSRTVKTKKQVLEVTQTCPIRDTARRDSLILGSSRSNDRNEDDYEFICLASVRMHSFPWHVTQAGNSLLANEILRKIVFTRTRSTIVLSSNSLKFSKTLRRRLLLLVSSRHSIIAVITRIFSFSREKDAII